jgi:hypothetical protein
MVNDPLHSTMVKLTRSAFAGKPFTVSEVNHPNPNEYGCEMIPLLAAYGAFQDWDGIFFYTFEPKISDWQEFVPDPFDLTLDPVKMVQLEAGALLFLRPDVRPALTVKQRSYSTRQINESLRLPEAERPYFTPGFPLSLPLRHGSRVKCLDCEPTPAFAAEDRQPIVSDTGELAWEVAGTSNGLVRIDTPRSQALVGFVKAAGQGTSQLSAEVKNDFCALTISSLDGLPLKRSATRREASGFERKKKNAMPIPPIATTVETPINPNSSPSLASEPVCSAWSAWRSTLREFPASAAAAETVKLGSRNRSNRPDPPSACGKPTYPATIEPNASTTSATAIGRGASCR